MYSSLLNNWHEIVLTCSPSDPGRPAGPAGPDGPELPGGPGGPVDVASPWNNHSSFNANPNNPDARTNPNDNPSPEPEQAKSINECRNIKQHLMLIWYILCLTNLLTYVKESDAAWSEV